MLHTGLALPIASVTRVNVLPLSKIAPATAIQYKKIRWQHLTKMNPRVTEISGRARPILQRYPSITAAYVREDSVEALIFWAVVPPSFGYDRGALTNDLQEEFGTVDVCLATTEQLLNKMPCSFRRSFATSFQ
jgi:hypothetical protein